MTGSQGGGKFLQDFLSLAAFLLPLEPWCLPLDGAQPSPRSPADQNAFLDVNIHTHTKKILIYLCVCVLYTWVCFKNKPKAGALSQAHHPWWQQWEHLGTTEPPACGPGHQAGSQRPIPAAGKWLPAPTLAPSPFLRKGSQPHSSEDIDTGSMEWLQCRTWEVMA